MKSVVVETVEGVAWRVRVSSLATVGFFSRLDALFFWGVVGGWYCHYGLNDGHGCLVGGDGCNEGLVIGGRFDGAFARHGW